MKREWFADTKGYTHACTHTQTHERTHACTAHSACRLGREESIQALLDLRVPGYIDPESGPVSDPTLIEQKDGRPTLPILPITGCDNGAGVAAVEKPPPGFGGKLLTPEEIRKAAGDNTTGSG